jgi:hypothetical protein
VPWSELACCRVRWDGVLRAMQLSCAALQLLSEPAARACCQVAYLHGMGDWRPTHSSGEFLVLGWRHVPRRGGHSGYMKSSCRVFRVSEILGFEN